MQVPKTSKITCVKAIKNFQCFESFNSCVQILSCDYCDGVSAKLKYLNSYDYMLKFGKQPFWIQGDHDCNISKQSNLFRNGSRYPVIYRFLCFRLIYSKAVAHFCYYFKLQHSAFWYSILRWLFILMCLDQKIKILDFQSHHNYFQGEATPHYGLSNVTGVISKLNSQGLSIN